MQRLSLFSIVLTTMLTLSCQEETLQEEKLDLRNLSFEGIDVFDGPITVDLQEHSLAEVYAELAGTIFEEDVESRPDARAGEAGFVGVDIRVDEDEATITPVEASEEDDDELCGGKKGDGWTSYGKCFTEKCVENKLLEASKDLGDPKPGKCLDLRVRRTLTSARVCGRMVNC